MTKTIQSREDARTWQEHYDPLAPKAGDIAPAFELQNINGEDPVRLSDFRNKKPVALVFGSFT